MTESGLLQPWLSMTERCSRGGSWWKSANAKIKKYAKVWQVCNSSILLYVMHHLRKRKAPIFWFVVSIKCTAACPKNPHRVAMEPICKFSFSFKLLHVRNCEKLADEGFSQNWLDELMREETYLESKGETGAPWKEQKPHIYSNTSLCDETLLWRCCFCLSHTSISLTTSQPSIAMELEETNANCFLLVSFGPKTRGYHTY